MVVQHALVGIGLSGNAVDARASEPMRGKFLLRRLENAQPHTHGIALPLQSPLWPCSFFCQTLRPVMVPNRCTMQPAVWSMATPRRLAGLPWRALQKQRLHATGTAAHAHHPRAGLAAG